MQNITSLFVVGNGERLLAHVGNRLTTLNATTGAVEEVLANDCNAVVYGPPGADAGDNLLVARDRGVLAGNADRPELRRLLEWMPYSSAALVGPRLVLCHHFLGNYRFRLAVHDAGGRELTVLVDDRATLPVWGLAALGTTGVAGLAPDWIAAWNLTGGQRWRVALDVSYDHHLAASADGSRVLATTNDGQLHCLAGADGAAQWQYLPTPAADGAAMQLRNVLVRHERVLCLFANGEASCLDLATGHELGREMLNASGTDNGALAAENELYVLHADSSVARYDVRDWLGEVGGRRVAPAAGTFALPAPDLAADALLAYVQKADWRKFRWETDAEPLRDALREAEQRLGVTEAHRAATDRLLALAQGGRTPFFKLTHSRGFRSEMESWALSRDGRYFAAGSWIGEEYDAGGDLQIWDVASGRVVNRLGPVHGGVGWSSNGGVLEWSPDGQLLGLSLDTNATAAILPFADDLAKQAEFYDPTGNDEPPSWCWHPEGKALFVMCWMDDCTLPGAVVPVAGAGGSRARKEYGFKAPRGLKKLFTAEELEEAEEEDATTPLHYFDNPQWLTSGVIGGVDEQFAYTLDPTTRTLGTLLRVEPGGQSDWSPDGQWLLQLSETELRVRDAAGQLNRQLDVAAHFGPGPGQRFFYFHPDPARQLLLVVKMGPDGGIAFYHNFELLGVARTAMSYTWALSPDGQAAATVAPDGVVTVWDLAPGNVRARGSFPGLADSRNLFFGAGQRLIMATNHEVVFLDATTGERLVEYKMSDKPTWDDNPYLEDEDDERSRDFFALDPEGDTQWVGALPTGEVLAPDAVLPRLDQELTYVFGNRLPWPYRWGTVRRLETLPEEN